MRISQNLSRFGGYVKNVTFNNIMSKKISCGIIGTGNIGCDLLVKIMKSKYLECVMFAGQREDSPGIAFAKNLKIATATNSIEAILDSDASIVFDATSA